MATALLCALTSLWKFAMINKFLLKGTIALGQLLQHKEHLLSIIHGCRIACITFPPDRKLRTDCEDGQ